MSWLFRLGLLVAVLFALSACGGTADEGQPILEIPADAELASPAGELPPSDDGAIEPDASYPPLDLGVLGDNASSSGLPNAVPDGLEVGFTKEGYPYRGSANAAVTLIEYSDYACPFCGRHTAQNVPSLLEQYGAGGDVRFIFREFPLVGLHPTAPAAHAAALCAGEQSAELYWALHDEIFARQADWTSLPDPSDFLAAIAEGLGVDAAAYEECLASGRAEEQIAAGVADAEALGFNGTPSFELVAEGVDGTYTIIGAQALDTFTSYFDSLLAGEAPADPAPEPGEEPEPPGLPVWANRSTGLQPDPDRPGINQTGDQYKGDPEAPLVVIEFSDFQCPFCRDHALEVQPAVDEALIDTGRVMWVYKHLPLNIHPLAPIAGAAAECASDQGRFWEMHEALFETLEVWSEGDTEAGLAAAAEDVGLDVAAFETCLQGREALERVLADQADAAGIISQTPSFVVIRGDRGSLVEGSRDADQFVQLLEGFLADLEGS